MAGLGSDNQDQMSINFLKARWAFFGNFTMNYNDASQSLIYSQNVGPNSFNSTYIAGTSGSKNVSSQVLTPVGFLGQLFHLYRGGFMVKFHFYKTQFHTGRLLICYSSGTTVPSLATSAYLHRAIIDLSAGNEVCLSFPYTAVSDYLSTHAVSGYFYVFTLNPLRGPDAVMTSIDVTMEVCGAPDLEYQVPANAPLDPIVCQMGGDEETPDNLLCENIGGSVVPQQIAGSSQYCVGEHVTSVLQLCKAYTRWALPSLAWAAQGVVRIAPFVTQSFSMVASTATLTTPVIGGDYIDLLSGCYAYQRGGVRFRISTANSTNAWSAWIESSTRGVSTYNLTVSESITNGNQAFVRKFIQPGSEGGTSVQVPAYGKYYTRLCRFTNVGDPQFDDVPDVVLAIESIGGPSANPGIINVQRAAADDFQFSYFVGVPEIYWDYSGLGP
jgi:hypothetical protein